jgi:hypothetical protein
VREELTLDGVSEADGVRWFRRMTMTQDGQPFFELEISDLSLPGPIDDPLLAGPAP